MATSGKTGLALPRHMATPCPNELKSVKSSQIDPPSGTSPKVLAVTEITKVSLEYDGNSFCGLFDESIQSGPK